MRLPRGETALRLEIERLTRAALHLIKDNHEKDASITYLHSIMNASAFEAGRGNELRLSEAMEAARGK